MSAIPVISLSGYRAHRAAERLRLLPADLRTAERARPALEAIVAYAWEETAAGLPAEPAQVCRRLEEFVPRADPGIGQWELMGWLFENLVPEVWESPALLKGFLSDCILRR